MAKISRAIDLAGKRFGRLVVLERAENDKWRAARWLCQCDCGQRKVILGHSLRLGATQSCGCLAREASVRNGLACRKAPGVSAANTLLGKYQRSAKKRGVPFLLTGEEFWQLAQGNCHYCGEPPRPFRHRLSATPFVSNGLDRKDNTLGYTPDNCVPCCWLCNNAKKARDYNAFLAWVERIHTYQKDTNL